MLVSVIIPCFNVEKYISECINSVVAQTYPDIEIICIDNNSTDNTFEILQGIKNKYTDKIQVLQEFIKGAPCARNKGLSISKGEWVQFLDADDLLYAEKIQHQVNIALENERSSFIAGAFVKQSVEGKKEIVNLDVIDPFQAVFITRLGITSANLFKKDKVVYIGGWDEKLESSQESDLMFRLLKLGVTVTYDPMPLTIIKERESGQISQKNPKRKWIQYVELRWQIVEYLIVNMPGYFSLEKTFYYEKFFLQLRRLAEYDVEAADEFYKCTLKNKFLPKVNEINSGFYITFLKYFGFKRTEYLRKIFSKLK